MEMGHFDVKFQRNECLLRHLSNNTFGQDVKKKSIVEKQALRACWISKFPYVRVEDLNEVTWRSPYSPTSLSLSLIIVNKIDFWRLGSSYLQIVSIRT